MLPEINICRIKDCLLKKCFLCTIGILEIAFGSNQMSSSINKEPEKLQQALRKILVRQLDTCSVTLLKRSFVLSVVSNNMTFIMELVRSMQSALSLKYKFPIVAVRGVEVGGEKQNKRKNIKNCFS